ncbi:hypothetical protein STEPF1_07169 [Streptomyces sp. F-1]|nr:hypothetical protein STEPF1_07169 [Streptomyces sp. F-1]
MAVAMSQFTTQSSSDGIVERDFTVGDIPGALWSPEPAAGPRPPARRWRCGAARRVMGHGGGSHKKWPGMVGWAAPAVL